uniref:Saposin B-type domain-containing protein n=1 Tax=Heterorhabditis bacteriophora TaxID=37862 RepID=A0A1I7XU55_HETBA
MKTIVILVSILVAVISMPRDTRLNNCGVKTVKSIRTDNLNKSKEKYQIVEQRITCDFGFHLFGISERVTENHISLNFTENLDLGCEICLDMVMIGETYAECGEAEVENALEKKCDVDFHAGDAIDRICRGMIEQIAHEVIKDTEKNPSAVCYKVIHKHCTYGVVGHM